jgi:hypothetical protein
MAKTAYIAVIVFMAASLARAQIFPDKYHTVAEGISELQALVASYPEICSLDSIGHSNRDSLPIFLFKISDNVAFEEDEPAIFFNGGVHADEILGVEVVLRFSNDIVARYAEGDSQAQGYINDYEIFVIPFINPEGHIVVEEGDLDWRKNKSDNNGNGIFDFPDGVDNNRNYDFGWDIDNAPDAIEPESLQYKGPYPFSESENRALADIGAKYRPIIAIDYHSPTYGRSEVVYCNWYWYPDVGGHGYAPDYSTMINIGTGFAAAIIDDDGDSTYEARTALVNKGDFKTYYYANFGTAAFSCEVSDTTIQDTSMVDSICERNLAGMYYLLNRAGYARLTGIVADSVTGLPLEAEVEVEQARGVDINPRYTRANTGRYDRLIDPGTYTLIFRKEGYHPDTVTGVVVNNSGPTTTNVFLVPLSPPPPSTPVLVLPSDGWVSPVAFLNFDWTDSPGATGYAIQIDDDVDFATPVVNDSALIESHFENGDSLVNGAYFWRVRAGNSFGWSDFSAIWSFEVLVDTSGLEYLVGDVNHNGQVNGIDVVYFVTYLKGGPPPPLEIDGFYPEADVNGNCQVNGIDVVYFVSYLKGGPGPIDGHCLGLY